MATWTDQIYGKVRSKRDNFVLDAYEQARTTFLNVGVNDCSFRDIEWVSGDNLFRIIETGQGDNTFTLQQKLKYFDQLVQLIVIGSEQVVYS